MKKLLIGLCLLIGVTAQAQFPSIDSLRKYNNKYITSSALDAFTNKRLNTVLNGILNYTDSAYRASPAGKLDSIVLSQDSILIGWKAGSIDSRDTIRGLGGGSTVDTTSLSGRIDKKIDTIYAVNDSTVRFSINGVGADILIRGVGPGGSAANNYTISSTFSGNTFTQNRNSLSALLTTIPLKDSSDAIMVRVNTKQAALVAGTNIKNINGASPLGSGNLVVTAALDGFYDVSDADTVNIIYSNGKKQRVTYTGPTAIKFTGFPNSGVIELQLISGADGSYITNLPNAPSNEDYAMESGGISKYVGTYDSLNGFAWNFNLRTGAPVPDSLFAFHNGGHAMLALTAPLANKDAWAIACKTQLNFNYMMLYMDFWDATYRARMDTMANVLERNGMTFFPQIASGNPRADIDSMVKRAFTHGNLTRIRGKQTIAFYYGTPTSYNNLVADLPALGIPRDSINIICSPLYPHLSGSTWIYSGGSYPSTKASVTEFNTIGYDGYIPFMADHGGTDSAFRQNILNENQWLYESCVSAGRFMFLGIMANYMNPAVQQTSMSYSAIADVGNYPLSQANYYNYIVGLDWTTLNDYHEESAIAPLPTESEAGTGSGFWPPLGSSFVFGPTLNAAPLIDTKGAVQFFDIYYQAYRRHRTSLNITSSEVFIKTALHPRSVSVGSTIPSPWSTDALYNSTWWNGSDYANVPAWVSNATKFVMFDRIQMAAYLMTPGKLKINSTVSSTMGPGLCFFDIALTSGTPTISIMETDGTTVRKTGTSPLPITTTAYKGGFRSMFLKL